MCALLPSRRLKSAAKCREANLTFRAAQTSGASLRRFQLEGCAAQRVWLGNSFLIQSRAIQTGSPTRKLVYLCLCDHANDETGLCWPSVKTICEETELSERVVRRVISELENLSLLKVERRGEKHLVSRYWVTKQGCTTSTLRVHQEQAKGARSAWEGAPRAPQASGSLSETTKGNGHTPKKFVSELVALVREANEEIQRLKDSGDPSKKPRIRELCQKRREWREEMLSQ